MHGERHIYHSTQDERNFESSYLKPEDAHMRAKESLAEYEIKPEIFAGLYGDPVLVFKIKSEEIAKNYRTFFESLWGLCTP